MPRRVQRDGTADAEVGPQQRARKSRRDAAVHPDGEFDAMRHARERPVQRRSAFVVETQRHESRRGLNDGVSKLLREAEPCAIAAAFGEGLAASGEHHLSARQRALRCSDEETIVGGLDAEDPVVDQQSAAGVVERAQQRVQHVARAVAVGEELAVGFLVQGNVQLLKESNGIIRGECVKHSFDQGSASAPEVGLGDDPVRHVAASAAADQDLRPGAFLRRPGPRRIARG